MWFVYQKNLRNRFFRYTAYYRFIDSSTLVEYIYFFQYVSTPWNVWIKDIYLNFDQNNFSFYYHFNFQICLFHASFLFCFATERQRIRQEKYKTEINGEKYAFCTSSPKELFHLTSRINEGICKQIEIIRIKKCANHSHLNERIISNMVMRVFV